MKVVVLVLVCFGFLFAKVDINSASKQELMSLNGIGAKKADAIIAHRNQKCFSSVDALMQIKGIGKKILETNQADLEALNCH